MPTTSLFSHHRLLAGLSKGEQKRLLPLFEDVPLTVKRVLYKARAPIDYAYFSTISMLSATTVMLDGTAIEVATIGNEGLSGLSAMVGCKTSPYEVMVQAEGRALRIKASAFREEANKNGAFRDMLSRYHTAFTVQVSYSVACNGLHKVEKRCCRWLLTCQDRIHSDELPLTHEFLSIMLGVRRASVTEVLQPLQQRGIIDCLRGKIQILNRPALEALTCECYQAVNDEFAYQFDWHVKQLPAMKKAPPARS